MKVLFKENKDIEFIEEAGQNINVNDFMAHRLMARTYRILSRRESLWVKFQSTDNPSIRSHEAMLQLEFNKGEEWYVLMIPESVTRVPGQWEFQLSIKRVNTEGDKFELVYDSNPAKFTVADGLSGESTPTVTNETIASLYETAKEALKKLEAVPEITTDDEGKFLRVVDGKWKASTVPIAENENF